MSPNPPNKNDLGIFILRLFVGLRVIYGVIDNVFSWSHMLEFSAFLEQFQFPYPLLSAIASVSIQFIGGILILTGLRFRSASFVLTMNFLIALIFVHFRSGDSIEVLTPALALFSICLAFVFIGAGDLTIERVFKRK